MSTPYNIIQYKTHITHTHMYTGTLPNIGKLEPSTAIVGDNHAQLPMSAGMHLSAELHQHHNHRHNHRHNNNNTIERDVENTSPLLFQPHLNKVRAFRVNVWIVSTGYYCRRFNWLHLKVHYYKIHKIC